MTSQLFISYKTPAYKKKKRKDYSAGSIKHMPVREHLSEHYNQYYNQY